MIRRSTWIWLGLLAVALLAAYYLQFVREPAADSLETSEPVSTQFLFDGIEAAEVASLTITGEGGKTLEIHRDDQGLWNVTQPEGGTTDQAQVDALVSQVLTMQTMVTLNPVDDLEVYGLMQGSSVITLVLNGGQEHILHIGDLAPTNNGYYVRVDGEAPTVASSFNIDQVLNFLDNPPFAATPTPEVTGAPAATGTGEVGEETQAATPSVPATSGP
jgi:hypothetical protein